ncbi:MAG: AraC family transcriptional regulator [Thermomicrobiales bacterium]
MHDPAQVVLGLTCEVGGRMEREATGREAFVRAMLEAMPRDGSYPLRDGLQIHRVSYRNHPALNVPKPAFCVIAQGRKLVRLGEETYAYDAEHYLLASVDLPVSSQIVEASPERPYLSMRMELDASMVTSVLLEADIPKASPAVRAMDVGRLDDGMRDVVMRLLAVVRSQPDASYLATLAQREIVYRLLTGDQGARLRYLMAGHIATQGIAQAIDRVRREFDQVLRMDDLAQDLGMSVSALHHRFKAATAMSPLQFQKLLRLQEARRLMMQEGFDATMAGLQVGYGSQSQFSREYKRQFGEPPMRDIERMRLASPMPQPAD